MRLAERTAHFLSARSARRELSRLAVETWGLPEDLLRPVAVAAVKGALEAHDARDRQLRQRALHGARTAASPSRETRHEEPGNYARSIRVTLIGRRGAADAPTRRSSPGSDARVVAVDGLPLEFRPEGTVVFLRNRDVPGVVGSVGTILGEAGVNIAELLARARRRRRARPRSSRWTRRRRRTVLERLRRAPAVEEVRVVSW